MVQYVSVPYLEEWTNQNNELRRIQWGKKLRLPAVTQPKENIFYASC